MKFLLEQLRYIYSTVFKHHIQQTWGQVHFQEYNNINDGLVYEYKYEYKYEYIGKCWAGIQVWIHSHKYGNDYI